MKKLRSNIHEVASPEFPNGLDRGASKAGIGRDIAPVDIFSMEWAMSLDQGPASENIEEALVRAVPLSVTTLIYDTCNPNTENALDEAAGFSNQGPWYSIHNHHTIDPSRECVLDLELVFGASDDEDA